MEKVYNINNMNDCNKKKSIEYRKAKKLKTL